MHCPSHNGNFLFFPTHMNVRVTFAEGMLHVAQTAPAWLQRRHSVLFTQEAVERLRCVKW